ncbi:MAG: MBL fold metallo-hydrolase, partial [Deltaproteobacteria bacterium]|nr:MBL fold metallo-hydrolase [Deltaproteobacteria bacterium]
MLRPTAAARDVERFPARTPTLPPATHTNSYALGGAEVLLVEPATPYDEEVREWLAWARGISSSGRRIVGVFVTHHHGDHVGGAAVIRRELGVPLLAHELAAPALPTPVDRLVADGEALVLAGPEPSRWVALHTPGHARGHLCLHEAERGALIAGDMVASEGTILIAPGDGDMREYLAQLTRLRGLGAAVVLPAHGDPIVEADALFERYLRHRSLREAMIIAALGALGPGASLDALVDRAYGDAPAAARPFAR